MEITTFFRIFSLFCSFIAAALGVVAVFIANDNPHMSKVVRVVAVAALIAFGIDLWLRRVDTREAKAMEGKLEVASRQADEANEKAEKERLGRLELEKRIAGRSLTPEQQALLREALAIEPGEVHIDSRLSDSEGESYGHQFATVFGAAGWHVTVAAQLYKPIDPGLTIATPLDKGVPPGAAALMDGLRKANVPFTRYRLTEATSPTKIYLLIGAKPTSDEPANVNAPRTQATSRR
jgi:hypothetical protein